MVLQKLWIIGLSQKFKLSFEARQVTTFDKVKNLLFPIICRVDHIVNSSLRQLKPRQNSELALSCRLGSSF